MCQILTGKNFFLAHLCAAPFKVIRGACNQEWSVCCNSLLCLVRPSAHIKCVGTQWNLSPSRPPEWPDIYEVQLRRHAVNRGPVKELAHEQVHIGCAIAALVGSGGLCRQGRASHTRRPCRSPIHEHPGKAFGNSIRACPKNQHAALGAAFLRVGPGGVAVADDDAGLGHRDVQDDEAVALGRQEKSTASYRALRSPMAVSCAGWNRDCAGGAAAVLEMARAVAN